MNSKTRQKKIHKLYRELLLAEKDLQSHGVVFSVKEAAADMRRAIARVQQQKK